MQRRPPLHARRPAALAWAVGTTLAAGAALLGVPAGASAAVTDRTADMNASGFAGFDQTNATSGTLSVDGSRTYEGAGAAHARYGGGGANGYQRGVMNVGWSEGDDVHYGAAFFLPSGFSAKNQSQTDLLRWDTYGAGSTVDYGGIGMLGDGRAHLYRMAGYVPGSSGGGSGFDADLSPSFALPEGRWFWLEVHQRLSSASGRAVNEVRIDGRLVSSSTAANTYGGGITRLRVGLVSIGEGKQTNPLELWFDRAMVRRSPIGALGAAPAPPSEPSPGGSSGSGSGSGSGTTTKPKRKKKRQRLTKARVRNSRLTYVVRRAGMKKPVSSHYRKTSQRSFRTYRRGVRLRAGERRRSTVSVRAAGARWTLKIRNGSVKVRPARTRAR
ncbi:MAG: hypothetical protein AB7G37_11285 [Solirubrobacteraceae bacterium]